MMTIQPIRLAPLTFALSCIAVLLATSLAPAQSSSLEFPYQALVSKDNALVRSGPGKVHYGTQKLAAGQVVEVYRHDPDGWCAIRPVDGSFSILPESTVEVIAEGVGEIKLAGTTPFVGTKLGTVDKPLWQVKLREKEKVSLIGQLSWPSPEGHSTVWYQIKPPAGEFRWINISNLESLSGETMTSLIQPKPQEMAVETMPPQPTQPTTGLASTNSSSAISRSTAEIPRQPSVVPVKPSLDLATSQQIPNQQNAQPGNAQPSVSAHSQSLVQAVESKQFDRDESEVQLASFVPTTPAPAAAPTPPPTTAPPLQDSGGGWRRATREIPSASSSTNSNIGFTAPTIPDQSRSKFGSSPSYNNSSFASQNQQNFDQLGSNRNQPYNLNSGSQPQSSFTGQIRVADANPDRNQFAQQLNQTRGLAQTYTGQTTSANAIQTLDNRLTMEMLKAPSAWQLDPLEAATRQYMSTGGYAEQQAGTRFLAKLANCRRVAAGYGGSGTPNGSGLSNGQAGYGSANPVNYSGSNANVGSNTFGPNAADNSQFDATGWLNELKQARGKDPSTYVLQDASGKIIYHVTPMPGLNLGRYLRKRVGIKGQLGFNQKLNLRHVTVERVFPL